ncbi:Eco57I restriction-modification methylase domain-containing protein [Enterobacter hormaechei]|uniref:Eco57I restriction-modification methylase domain-containing protein n=1 Tax=Enterobacter hormaechei TaxID=158836 RepID=UPI00264E109B|nr:Eco57I restriction-modification methylase domain-containing protein [Enterobacter hormaechei]MDN8572561.1 Eco57I restriction-modification methylase domain-containing protein [Enterobacter hormaechei]
MALELADTLRREMTAQPPGDNKTRLGQFMTPAAVARFMASLFPAERLHDCHLLDAGAGLGALTCAFLERCREETAEAENVTVTAYEADPSLALHLRRHLNGYVATKAEIITDDYVMQATADGLLERGYTHAILNPPYRKISSQSAHRKALRRVGIETVNLYSAFVALALGEMVTGGQMVAIIPRSFCNGPYYRPFRDFILERSAIRHLHLFRSRSDVFRDDGVLQENIIIRLERGGEPGPVTVTVSSGDNFTDMTTHDYQPGQIVFPDDPDRFIHIPDPQLNRSDELPGWICHSLDDIGLKVSTGPVVDFRLKAHLRDIPSPEEDTVPLLYPGHISQGDVTWPATHLKKPGAIVRNAETERWLYPGGFYCVVRRFSAREERRRIVAGVAGPDTTAGAPYLGFENHLNVFHENRSGLPEALARGMAVFLNSTAVDTTFRRFSGHTQVNATDLRRMKYPDRDTLISLGERAMRQGGKVTQVQADAWLKDSNVFTGRIMNG